MAGVRVVAGEFGGRRLLAPDGLATRPTTDRVREATFNSLQSHGDLEGVTCADLYAGSGALGIEALSRGAAHCTFVERDRDALAALRANIAALSIGERCTVHATDVLAWLPAMRGVELVFIDPPYSFEAWEQLLATLGALADVRVIVVEASRVVAAPPGWEERRTRRYGRTWVTMLDRVAPDHRV